MTIGIDIGSTATKAVSIESENNFRFYKAKTKTDDPVSSASGAFGKLISENSIGINTIKRIRLTGVGAAIVPDSLFGIPVEKVSEISSIGTGGMFISGQKNIIIANIGTGTALVEARKDGVCHLGGTGVGGGTILGLGKKLLGLSRFADIMALAENGDLSQVDLLMEDITANNIGFLNRKATASNFGKMLDTAGAGDIALGIVSMVYQVIGTSAVFAARSRNAGKVIVTGNGSNNHIGKNILAEITKMYSVGFEYPENAEYSTALGAALLQ
jgi:type II pantothenate kinase